MSSCLTMILLDTLCHFDPIKMIHSRLMILEATLMLLDNIQFYITVSECTFGNLFDPYLLKLMKTMNLRSSTTKM